MAFAQKHRVQYSQQRLPRCAMRDAGRRGSRAQRGTNEWKKDLSGAAANLQGARFSPLSNRLHRGSLHSRARRVAPKWWCSGSGSDLEMLEPVGNHESSITVPQGN